MCSRTKFCVWIVLIFYLPPIQCYRKYDVELEALRLYKEDVRTCLTRFRRTPEYLMILKEKIAKNQQIVENMAMMTLFNFNRQLVDQVKDMMYGSHTGSTRMEDEGTTASLRSKKKKNIYRFRRLNPYTPNPQMLRTTKDVNTNLVEVLDSYKKLTTKLTVAQKNMLKKLGFQYASKVIKTIISNLQGTANDIAEEIGLSTIADAFNKNSKEEIHVVNLDPPANGTLNMKDLFTRQYEKKDNNNYDNNNDDDDDDKSSESSRKSARKMMVDDDFLKGEPPLQDLIRNNYFINY